MESGAWLERWSASSREGDGMEEVSEGAMGWRRSWEDDGMEETSRCRPSVYVTRDGQRHTADSQVP